MDISHRGGETGFVRIDGQTLSVADYPGNRFFNTIGNLELNPLAGLMFIDHVSGELLQLAVRAHVEWLPPPDTAPPAPEGRCISRCWRQSAPPGPSAALERGDLRCGARRIGRRQSIYGIKTLRPGIHRVATAVIAALLVQRFAIEGTGAPLPSRTALRFCHPRA